MKYIPYGRQWIEEEDIQAVVNVLCSDFLTTGPEVPAFEKEFAEYVGVRYAVAVSNGTAALHVACMAAGLKKGDEVITTPVTFAASANCALYCGAVPVFADIDAETYNISPDRIREKITDRTKAVLPVHYTGQPCDMDEIHKLAEEYGLTVIEDAAHGLGAEYRGKKVGGLSALTTFSFHPVKHITTGEGGMVTTNDKELYEKLLLYRSHGITREETLLTADEGAWYYEQLALGYNYRMTDIQAALGRTQLKKLDGFLEKRRKIAARYDKAFAGTGLVCPHQMEGVQSSWHLYVIQVPPSERKRIFGRLREKGIGVNVHYIPVYHHPYYRENGYAKTVCENSEKLYAGLISLPIFPGLTEEEQEYVIQNVLAAAEEGKA